MFSKNIAITDTTDGLPNPRRIWAVIAASLALIMSVLDANIVNVVLPTLSREFGTSPSTTIWVMNAYQLAITVSLLSFSSLGDIYGYHKVFSFGSRRFLCHVADLCLIDFFLDADCSPGAPGVRSVGHHKCEYGTTPDHLSPEILRTRLGDQCDGRLPYRLSQALLLRVSSFR